MPCFFLWRNTTVLFTYYHENRVKDIRGVNLPMQENSLNKKNTETSEPTDKLTLSLVLVTPIFTQKY